MDPNILNQGDEEFLATLTSGTAEVGNAEGSAPSGSETVEEPAQPAKAEVTTEAAQDDSGDASDTGTSDASENQEEAAEASEGEPKKEEEPFDYKAAYEKITAPFKANGKQIEIKSPDEIIQMMKMGANYTRKMQSIAPYRKALLMLQNNDLLDESKISFLIDLNRKDPAAVQKLIKDSGIDPLDIDINAESTYQPGHHQISDSEAALSSVLEDVTSTQEGRETVQIISKEWDQASKEALLEDPNIVAVINEQRQNGVYDTIVNEIERLRILGSIPANTSFLECYKNVGMSLYGQTGTPTQAPATPSVSTAPVARTVASPSSTRVPNTDKIQATAPARSVGSGKTKIDPLSLPDEEFMQIMSKRV